MNEKFLKVAKKSGRPTSVTLLASTFLFIFVPFALSTSGLSIQTAGAVAAKTVTSPFLYTFDSTGSLPESGSMNDSWSPYFWVNSGAYLKMKDGYGGTVQGPLPASDPWRVLYSKTNPLDTGNGYYPQNIFRLVTRSQWTNTRQEMQFKIDKTNLTNTPNRDGYSGVLFFSRYRDGNNLYYAGIRQDGAATIKKKLNGTYYTLAQKTVWSGTYNKTSNPTLIPQQKWMRMRLVTQNQADGSVALTLYVDQNNTGNYVEVVRAVDKPGVYGSSVVNGPAYAGIRTDYEDVLFNDYRLTEL